MVNGYMLYNYVLILRSSQIQKSNNELIRCDIRYIQLKQNIEIRLMRVDRHLKTTSVVRIFTCKNCYPLHDPLGMLYVL